MVGIPFMVPHLMTRRITRFIISRKGEEVEPALVTAMVAKMAEELDDF